MKKKIIEGKNEKEVYYDKKIKKTKRKKNETRRQLWIEKVLILTMFGVKNKSNGKNKLRRIFAKLIK